MQVGPGYPLLLEQIKHWGFLMTALAVFYFWPCSYLQFALLHHMETAEGEDKGDSNSRIGLFSLTAYIHGTGE